MPKRRSTGGKSTEPPAPSAEVNSARLTSATFETFTEDQWQAIRSIRKDWPDDIDWREVRRGIEWSGWAYWKSHRLRLQSGQQTEARKRLETLQRRSRELLEAFNALPDNFRSNAPRPDLTALDSWLRGRLTDFGTVADPGFLRNSDAYRADLYASLLEYWKGPLGGKLSFSRRPDDDIPYGMLIDFLTLTVGPILGRTPGPHGLAKIIDQYRKAGDLPF